MNIEPEQIYTPSEIAEAFSCGADYIRRQIRTRAMAAIALSEGKRPTYRIKGSDALQWFNGRYIQPESTASDGIEDSTSPNTLTATRTLVSRLALPRPSLSR